MTIHPTSLNDFLILEPRVFGDDRGFFLEMWNERTFRDIGIAEQFVQDNHSLSARGVLRGLHYQMRRPQGKLVWVVEGEVLDVVVDLRKSSPTFGRWSSVVLSGSNKLRAWVPRGFAHGFHVLSERAHFFYKCTDYYDPTDEACLAWNDPALGIDWRLEAGRDPLVSAKDAAGKVLAECPTFE